MSQHRIKTSQLNQRYIVSPSTPGTKDPLCPCNSVPKTLTNQRCTVYCQQILIRRLKFQSSRQRCANGTSVASAASRRPHELILVPPSGSERTICVGARGSAWSVVRNTVGAARWRAAPHSRHHRRRSTRLERVASRQTRGDTVGARMYLVRWVAVGHCL